MSVNVLRNDIMSSPGNDENYIHMLKGFILVKGVNDAKEFRKIYKDFDNNNQ